MIDKTLIEINLIRKSFDLHNDHMAKLHKFKKFRQFNNSTIRQFDNSAIRQFGNSAI